MQRSPRVLDLAWGRVLVEGRERPYKDVKLFPGGAREWDWSETGTHHQPGIQPGDVEELLENGAAVLVFGVGVYERLGVSSETFDLLKERGVAVEVHQTEKAVRVYNELSKREAVGALVHSTC